MTSLYTSQVTRYADMFAAMGTDLYVGYRFACRVGRQTQRDLGEVIFASFALLVGVSFFFLRRWLGLSHRLIKYEGSRQIEPVSLADQAMKSHSGI